MALVQSAGWFDENSAGWFYLRYEVYSGTTYGKVAQVFSIPGVGEYTPFIFYCGISSYAYDLENGTATWKLCNCNADGSPNEDSVIISPQNFVNGINKVFNDDEDSSAAILYNYLTEPLQKGISYAFIIERVNTGTEPRPLRTEDTKDNWQGYIWDGTNWVAGAPADKNNLYTRIIYFDGICEIYPQTKSGYEVYNVNNVFSNLEGTLSVGDNGSTHRVGVQQFAPDELDADYYAVFFNIDFEEERPIYFGMSGIPIIENETTIGEIENNLISSVLIESELSNIWANYYEYNVPVTYEGASNGIYIYPNSIEHAQFFSGVFNSTLVATNIFVLVAVKNTNTNKRQQKFLIPENRDYPIEVREYPILT